MNELIYFKDKNGIYNIGFTIGIRNNKEIGVIVKYSFGDTPLNTCVIEKKDIIKVFSDCKSLEDIEDKYPEYFI